MIWQSATPRIWRIVTYLEVFVEPERRLIPTDPIVRRYGCMSAPVHSRPASTQARDGRTAVGCNSQGPTDRTGTLSGLRVPAPAASFCHLESISASAAVHPMPLARIHSPFDHPDWIFDRSTWCVVAGRYTGKSAAAGLVPTLDVTGYRKTSRLCI